jgi:hypothetical protein
MEGVGTAPRTADSGDSDVKGIPSQGGELTNSYLFIDAPGGICRAGRLRRSKAGRAAGGVLLFI